MAGENDPSTHGQLHKGLPTGGGVRRRNWLKFAGTGIFGSQILTESTAAHSPYISITAQTETGSVAPGETQKIFITVVNDYGSSEEPVDLHAYFESAYDSEHNADYFGDEFEVVTHTDDGGSWEYEGWKWESVAPGERRDPAVELKVNENLSPGEYTFSIAAIDDHSTAYDDRANPTIVVESAGGDVSLSLTVTDDTAPPGGVATIEFRLTNTGSTESTGLQGYVDPPDGWSFAEEPGSFTSLAPGESETIPVKFNVPETVEGEYQVRGWVEDDAGNAAEDTATVTVQATLQLAVDPTRVTAIPGDSVSFAVGLENTSSEAVTNPQLGVNNHFVTDYAPLQGLRIKDHNDDGGAWRGDDRRGMWKWDALPAGETLSPTLTVALEKDVEPGEYPVYFDAFYHGINKLINGPQQTATIVVDEFTTLKAENRNLAARLDEISIAELEQESRVERIITAIENTTVDPEVAVAVLERLRWIQQLTNRTLESIAPTPPRQPEDTGYDLITAYTKGGLHLLVEFLLTKAAAAAVGMVGVAEQLGHLIGSWLMAVFNELETVEQIRNRSDDIVATVRSRIERGDVSSGREVQTAIDESIEADNTIKYLVNGRRRMFATTSIEEVLIRDGTFHEHRRNHDQWGDPDTHGNPRIRLETSLTVTETWLRNHIRRNELPGTNTAAEEAYGVGRSGIETTFKQATALMSAIDELTGNVELLAEIQRVLDSQEEGDLKSVGIEAVKALAQSIDTFVDTVAGMNALILLHDQHYTAVRRILYGEMTDAYVSDSNVWGVE